MLYISIIRKKSIYCKNKCEFFANYKLLDFTIPINPNNQCCYLPLVFD